LAYDRRVAKRENSRPCLQREAVSSCSARSQSTSGDPSGQPLACHSV
jgi:hypothetical protein